MKRIRIVCRTEPELQHGQVFNARNEVVGRTVAKYPVLNGRLADYTDCKVLLVLDDGTEEDIGECIQSIEWRCEAGLEPARATLQAIGVELDVEAVVDEPEAGDGTLGSAGRAALVAIAELAPTCHECREARDEYQGSAPASPKRAITHVTSFGSLPIYLCAEHAPRRAASYRKAESKGSGKQPTLVPYAEPNEAIAMAWRALGWAP